MRRQRTSECRVPSLAVHLDLEVAVTRRERDPAAGPVRCPRRTGTSATGSLLTPRLRTPTRNERARLRAARRGALRIHLRTNGLVNKVRLHLGAEDGCFER